MTPDSFCSSESKFHELLEYKHIHRNFDVRYNPQLTKWLRYRMSANNTSEGAEGTEASYRTSKRLNLLGSNFHLGKKDKQIPKNDMHNFLGSPPANRGRRRGLGRRAEKFTFAARSFCKRTNLIPIGLGYLLF
jgi:hypothetical protein